MLTSIKPGNAVLLFPDQVRNHQNGDARVRAVEAFTIIITKFISVPHDAYCATIAYHDGCFKRVASGPSKVTVVEALQSLLDTTTLALTAALPSKTVSDRDVKWVGRGGGAVMGHRVTPRRSEDGQVGGSPLPITEAFTVAVTRPWVNEYRAYLVYYQGSFKKAAHGEKKQNVLGALQSLLDTLASELDDRFAVKVGFGGGMDRVIRGEGEVMRDYAGDLGGL
ncbi:hypothetical protein LTR15_003719 [Elasticomyces elasticus]|nr:hypothetical protein LTR15_003719 [Elasticomyces elasticus]